MQYMSQGLPIAIIGYCMVFVVLCLLWGILEIMRIVFTHKKKEDKPVEKIIPAKPAEEDIIKPEVDESELVAVLTAAVAASLNTSAYNLKIKSYKRTVTGNNAWANASRNDAVNKF